MAKRTFDAEQQTGRVMVADGLTIAQVCQLREALLQGFDEAGQMVVDISTVADIDVAGLQLLCAAHRYAKQQGKELLLVGIGDRVRELARTAGFAHGMMCGSGGNEACFWSEMA